MSDPTVDKEPVVFQTTSPGTLAFQCPGCGYAHFIRVAALGADDGWSFNGDFGNPTFRPMLVVEREYGGDDTLFRCVSEISNGTITFQLDCNHGLAGQTVMLESRVPINTFAQRISKRKTETEV